MGENVLLTRMTWPEVEIAINDKRILIFSVGAMEQHGPHLPLGVDIFLPMEIAIRVARETKGVAAPCTSYGYKSLFRAGGGPHFKGSVGMRGTTLIALVSDLLEAFILQGWRRILVLDWHLENVPFVFEGVDEAVRNVDLGDELKIVKIDNPNGLGVSSEPDLETYLFGEDFPGWYVEHASIWETSAMLAVHPELVREEEIVDGKPPVPSDYDVWPVHQDGAPPSGVFWKASRASRSKGDRILNAVTKGIIQVIHKEFES